MASVIRGNDNFDSAGVGKNAGTGAVGSYAMLATDSKGVISLGTTRSGANLIWSGLVQYDFGSSTNLRTDLSSSESQDGNPSGTWKLLGSGTASLRYTISLWLRIS